MVSDHIVRKRGQAADLGTRAPSYSPALARDVPSSSAVNAQLSSPLLTSLAHAHLVALAQAAVNVGKSMARY